MNNAVKHGRPRDNGEPEPVHCTLRLSDEGVTLEIASRSRLPEGFNLSRIPGGVSGLGLVRALLPRRSASLTLEQRGDQVVASVLLVPPGVTQIDPAPAPAAPTRASGGA